MDHRERKSELCMIIIYLKKKRVEEHEAARCAICAACIELSFVND